jgi:hypothetical protein
MNDISDADPSSRDHRPRMRRVVRILREIDVWSVFKVALVVHAACVVVAMLTLTLLWSVASASGTIDNVENFLESFGWDTFTFRGADLFVNAGGVLILLGVLGTGVWVIAAVVFNLVTELVGGIRVTVLEEEVRLDSDTPDQEMSTLMES